MRVEFAAGTNDNGRRLEAVVRRLLPAVPLASLHKALRSGDIRLNGKKAPPDSRVSEGDVVSVWDRLLEAVEVAVKTPRPIVSPLPRTWIAYEDSDWVIVNKPSGVLVQGGPSGEPSLDDQVRQWLSPRLDTGLSFRAGPLHRLDRPTSGLVVFSASLRGARDFTAALESGKVRKTYWALLKGRLNQAVTVDLPLVRHDGTRRTEAGLDGKPATTTFSPLRGGSDWTWVEVNLEHGRTHQIRAHAGEIGHPLAGDVKYGAETPLQGCPRPWILHARQLDCSLFPRQIARLDEPTRRYLEILFKLNVEDADQIL